MEQIGFYEDFVIAKCIFISQFQLSYFYI